MPYKFKQEDLVFHTSTPEAPNVTGLYTVKEVGSDGSIYRLVDSNGQFTDANEDQIKSVEYALFTRIPEGWPIVVPVYIEEIYKRFLNSDKYNFICDGEPAKVLYEQAQILAKLEEQ